MKRRRSGIFSAALLFGTCLACAGGPATCVDASFAHEAQTAFDAVANGIDFVPVIPCGYSPDLVISSVTASALPGTPPPRRVSFIVEQSGERLYVLSETRAPVTSSAIPQSTHRLRLVVEDVVAEGFAGPSGSGGETAYLRWRTADITYELDATLGRALSETETQQIAAALMRRGVAAPSRPPGPAAGLSAVRSPDKMGRSGADRRPRPARRTRARNAPRELLTPLV